MGSRETYIHNSDSAVCKKEPNLELERSIINEYEITLYDFILNIVKTEYPQNKNLKTSTYQCEKIK